eukprot:scaffold1740_cov254-Pinguiococcus_pyrenoidosus.AAC.14
MACAGTLWQLPLPPMPKLVTEPKAEFRQLQMPLGSESDACGALLGSFAPVRALDETVDT